MILDLLVEGALNVSTVRLLAPHLTTENHVAVLAEARGRSKQAVEEIVARLSPRPDAVTIIRKLPAPVSAAPGPMRPVSHMVSASVTSPTSRCPPLPSPKRNDPCIGLS